MRKNIMLIVFSTYIIPSSYAMSLSFDRPFPMTWYEKGLNATTGLWHKVATSGDIESADAGSIVEESVDIMLGKCVFACFCLEKMRQSKQCLIDEDIAYFFSLIYSLEQELGVCQWEWAQEDQLICLEQLIAMMKNYLKAPGSINTK